MKYRFTIEVLRSGQPRPYADTEHVARVTFEHTDWKTPRGPFEPWYMTEDIAQDYLSIPGSGYVRATRKETKDWYSTYLDYVRPLDAKSASEVIDGGDPNRKVASVWEFRTVTPFTD